MQRVTDRFKGIWKKSVPTPKTLLEKRRPSHLAVLPYAVIQDETTLGAYFEKLKQVVFHEVEHSYETNPREPVVFREAGRVEGNRAYFYLKPQNEIGWLFERSEVGWVIARAEKITDRNFFLRHNEPYDVAVLYGSGEGMPRVMSKRFGKDLMSFVVYERCLSADLVLANSEGA